MFLTNMDQPLGNEVGNANEIAESIAVLRGEGPSDVTELVTAFGTAMLDATGVDDSNARIKGAVESGAALDKFAEMVEAQGGDTSVIDDPSTLPTAPHRVDVTAPQSGYVNAIDALAVGLTGVDLGAGRKNRRRGSRSGRRSNHPHQSRKPGRIGTAAGNVVRQRSHTG